MINSSQFSKVAFIYDDRLPHDRKTVFTRTMTILKPKFNIDILPSSMEESDLIAHLEKNDYSLILLPWYKYLSWKKVESHFGALRMQGTTVAGYFADAVLPFEFTKIPNFHRMILLDFYRFDQSQLEMILRSLTQQKKAGFTGIIPKNNPVFHADWFDQDHLSTRCLDAAMAIPLLKSTQWSGRTQSLRFYMTALWSLCFQERHSFPNNHPCATLEIAETNKKLVIKLVFESMDLTLKHMMDHLWPAGGDRPNLAVRELVKHCDFLRVLHYPESHHVEVTAFFTPEAPALSYPGEVRGFWVEPLKIKFLKSTNEEEAFLKRIPIHNAQKEAVIDQVQEVVDSLRNIHLQLPQLTPADRIHLEHPLSNVRFLLTEIEKKVAEKKKIA